MLNKSKIVIILFTYLYKKIELINLARFYLNVLLSPKIYGSLSNVGVKDRQIFVYPFSLF